MALIGIPIRLVFENMLKLMCNVVLELKYETWENWDLSAVSKTFLAFSILVVLLLILLSIGITIHAIAKRPKWLSMLIEGLNQRRIYLIFYFAHFYFIRILLALLIGLTSTISSKILWFIIVGFQLMFLILHFFKLYHKCINWFFAIWRETTILIIFMWIAVS